MVECKVKIAICNLKCFHTRRRKGGGWEATCFNVFIPLKSDSHSGSSSSIVRMLQVHFISMHPRRWIHIHETALRFHIHSNLRLASFRFSFLLQGLVIAHNASARVIRSNQSLVLQKVTRNSSGNYSCSAINAEGETVSNQLPLRVKCKYVQSLRADSDSLPPPSECRLSRAP